MNPFNDTLYLMKVSALDEATTKAEARIINEDSTEEVTYEDYEKAVTVAVKTRMAKTSNYQN